MKINLLELLTLTHISRLMERDIERLIAFALQSGIDVDGLTDGEREVLLNLEIDTSTTSTLR